MRRYKIRGDILWQCEWHVFLRSSGATRYLLMLDKISGRCGDIRKTIFALLCALFIEHLDPIAVSGLCPSGFTRSERFTCALLSSVNARCGAVWDPFPVPTKTPAMVGELRYWRTLPRIIFDWLGNLIRYILHDTHGVYHLLYSIYTIPIRNGALQWSSIHMNRVFHGYAYPLTDVQIGWWLQDF